VRANAATWGVDAKKLGVTFQTVNRWLNRHMKPGQIHEYHIKKMLSANRSERKDPSPNA
jgi:hypothetical protein